MTVKALIAALQAHDPAALVVLSKDAEGNGYSSLADLEAGFYAEDTTWAGDFYAPDDLFIVDEAVPAVCLGPVN